MSENRRRAHCRRIQLPLGRFRPNHCPCRGCRFHRPQPGWIYHRHGLTPSRRGRPAIPRYLCRSCRTSFTARTFSPSYWLHRHELFHRIVQLSVAGAGLRQIGRTLGISHSTVGRHLTRAGRQCLLFQRERLRDQEIQEPIAFDGFESFAYSQYFPFHLNLAVGGESWFLYHFTSSPLRRKGRMREGQKRTRRELEERLGRPDPKAVETGILELLRVLADPLPGKGLERGRGGGRQERYLRLESDEHPAYRRAVGRLRRDHPSLRVEHRVTSSRDPRTTANPLFPCNLADLLLRHCGANHRRETIAFSKQVQRALERAAVFAVWRNWVKWRREKVPGATAAMRAGLTDREWTWRRIFSRRRFPRGEDLPGSWWTIYWGEVKSMVYGESQAGNRLRYAY